MAVHPGSPLLSTPTILNSVSLWKHWRTWKNIDAQSPPPNSEVIDLWYGLDIGTFLRTIVLQDLAPCYISDLISNYSSSHLSAPVTQVSLLFLKALSCLSSSPPLLISTMAQLLFFHFHSWEALSIIWPLHPHPDCYLSSSCHFLLPNSSWPVSTSRSGCHLPDGCSGF